MDQLPPIGLARTGQILWTALWSNSCLPQRPDLHEVARLACKQADRAAECRDILANSGLLSHDRFGQEKPHPLVAVERSATATCAALVAQIVGKVTGEVKEAVEQEEDYFG